MISCDGCHHDGAFDGAVAGVGCCTAGAGTVLAAAEALHGLLS